MNRYYRYITLILLLFIPIVANAQDRPNAKQSKPKPKVYSNTKGGQIKHTKLVKTSDPTDEYSGVRTDPYGVKKNKKKVDNDTVDVADDASPKSSNYQDPYLFDESPQDKENEQIDRENLLQRPVNTPNDVAEDEEEDHGIITPHYALSQQDDPGTDSEEDILMAFDPAQLHALKMDISEMTPVEVKLTDAENGKFFVFPTPEYARPSSHFGPRRRRFHYGLDLAMPTGEPIYAAFDGVVRFSKYNSSYGNLIVIRHDNGLETYYAHLSKRHVTPGTRVKAGEEIGLCGNTGRSRGSHLHFEIRYKGNAINPENVISCETRTLLAPTITLNKNSFNKVAKPGYANNTSGRSSVGNYSKGGKYYKVRTGDTLSRIAKRNGTTIAKLCKLNNMKQNAVIRPGQTIRLR
ncbi:MAG: peptidoglycan DD-metalloendopeptidase family protein [Bacteroidales bacterium]|nr:peptidoglycan DD-metalloendopeptidase family protein [Bacteroidales bacterium]MBR3435603.1 peptidoglycan DD-metalloendopeptidase family protein [Bacteroidales bacterium]